jgi:hypothetical protein
MESVKLKTDRVICLLLSLGLQWHVAGRYSPFLRSIGVRNLEIIINTGNVS